jgi:hypothetical protein
MGEYLDALSLILPDSEIYLDDSYAKSIYVDSGDIYFSDDLLKCFYKLDFYSLSLEFMGYYADIIEY